MEYIIILLQGKVVPRFSNTITSLSVGLLQECAKYNLIQIKNKLWKAFTFNILYLTKN